MQNIKGHIIVQNNMYEKVEYKLSSETAVFLDLLRGLAAQIVLIGHILSFARLNTDSIALASLSVTVFFVLSGFLITFTVWRKKTSKEGYSFKIYFIERFSRIYSGFFISVIFILLIDLIHYHIFGSDFAFAKMLNVETFFANLLMLQDLYQNSDIYRMLVHKVTSEINYGTFGSGRPLWSISLEWWIYLFFGWIWLFSREKNNLKFWSIFVLLSIVPVGNLGLTSKLILDNNLVQTWLLGSFVFFIVFGKKFDLSLGLTKLFASVFLAASFIRFFTVVDKNHYDPKFQFLFFLFFLFTVSWLQKGKGEGQFFLRISGFSNWLASYSYTLYLVHYSIIYFISRFSGNPWIIIISSFFLSNLAAFYLAKLGENRNYQWRDWLLVKSQMLSNKN